VYDFSIASVLEEVGAPFLEQLLVPSAITLWESSTEGISMVKAMASMKRLKELLLDRHTIDKDAADAFVALLQESRDGGTLLLPKLNSLKIYNSFKPFAGLLRVFEALDPKIAFPNVEELTFRLENFQDSESIVLPSIQAIVSSLARGNFPVLDSLNFQRSWLIGDIMVALAEGLAACESADKSGGGRVKQLRKLSFCECAMSVPGFQGFARVLERGGLASLRSLSFKNNTLWGVRGGGLLAHLTEALRKAGHSSLQKLSFRNMQVDNIDLLALASLAMDKGKCLRNLLVLDISCNMNITDKGAVILSRAVEGMGELLSLDVSHTGIKEGGAGALVSALVFHCHKIENIYLFKLERAVAQTLCGVVASRFDRGKGPKLYG
jgi:Ran GTPase-activating protein (RanGAP) involved in mRNA processing and transport